MKTRDGDVAAAERALERLFRLSMNRRAETRQAAVVGAVVTRTGYAALRCLDETDDLTMGELARRCALDPAAAARQVRILQDDGLVIRSLDDGDGRRSMVRLTDRGRAVFRRVVAVRTAYLAEVLAGWSAADCAALGRLVERLADDLAAVPFRIPGER